MKKCNRINCPEYSSKCEGNCTLRKNVEDCLDLTQNFIFDLEWIPVTDEAKPEHFEYILLKIKHDHGIDFEKGSYNKENGCFSHHRTINYFNPKVTDWVRITLPGVEQ